EIVRSNFPRVTSQATWTRVGEAGDPWLRGLTSSGLPRSGVSGRRRSSSHVRRHHVSPRAKHRRGICKDALVASRNHPTTPRIYSPPVLAPAPCRRAPPLLPRPPLRLSDTARPTLAPPPNAVAVAATMPEPDDEGAGQQQQPKAGPALEGLVVGSYCHDVLLRGGRVVGETLGGAAAFVSNVLDAASPPEASFSVVSKVGPDFAYASAPAPARHPPLLCPARPTTSFHARFSDAAASAHAPDRQLRRVHACDPIYPEDLPDRRFAYGLAVGVAGEVLPETLERMIRLCRAVLVDAQALIRAFDAEGDGSGAAVRHVALEGTPYAGLLQRVAFLKASSEEAPYVGVETARRRCCVIVTEGRDGCRLYWDGGEARVAPFPAVQVDPTGAGDSYLAGFAAGLLWGLSATDAALLGNFFGAAAVSQVGVPTFHPKMLQETKQQNTPSQLS
uniref:Inositol 3-kinase n=1 Tax=Aegilops tauschii subsp. strangulata TaxID=200361 RepID=A0A453HCB3_AEGTS